MTRQRIKGSYVAMRLMVCVALCGLTTVARAQTDPEYLMEIGGGVGTMGYLGDFNGKLTSDLQPMASIVMRRLFNPFAGLKVSASWGKLKGSSKDVDTYYPEYRPDDITPTHDPLPY
jgi:hypothetical protein